MFFCCCGGEWLAPDSAPPNRASDAVEGMRASPSTRALFRGSSALVVVGVQALRVRRRESSYARESRSASLMIAAVLRQRPSSTGCKTCVIWRSRWRRSARGTSVSRFCPLGAWVARAPPIPDLFAGSSALAC